MPITFKTGNDYNFRPDKVILRRDETREDLARLNKIEIRYNTRATEPSYASMKSLYTLRSTFGYRLGGLIQQAIVTVHEVKRIVLNAVNFGQALAGTIARRFDHKVDHTLDTYTRLYSTRDIIANLKRINHGEVTEGLKHLKYMKYSDFSLPMHKLATTHDYSVRKLVVDGISDLAMGDDRPGKDGPSLRRFVTGNLHLDQIEHGFEKLKFRTKLRLENGARFLEDVSELSKKGVPNPLRVAHGLMVERSKEDTQRYKEAFKLGSEMAENRKRIAFDSPITFGKRPNIDGKDEIEDGLATDKEIVFSDGDLLVTTDHGDRSGRIDDGGKQEKDAPTLRDLLGTIRFDKRGEERAIPQVRTDAPEEGK